MTFFLCPATNARHNSIKNAPVPREVIRGRGKPPGGGGWHEFCWGKVRCCQLAGNTEDIPKALVERRLIPTPVIITVYDG